MQISNVTGQTIFNGTASDLPGKTLDGAVLHYAYLAGYNLTGCSLRGATFIGATLDRAKFNGADIRGAHFRAARMTGTDFTGAKYDGAPIPGWKKVDGLLEKKAEGECITCENTDQDHVFQQCGACEDCCDHVRCESCVDCQESVCRHCADCDSCCGCSTCQHGCDSLVTCFDCDGCSSCCACDSDDDDDDEDKPTGKPWAFTPGSKFKCKRTIGVEWEYNRKVDLSGWRSKWRGGVHYDGSCGYEAVTAPMAGDHIANCLKDLAKTFEETEALADERCGIHVHVDARDLKWADMYRLLWVYGKVEPLMYLLAGQHRARLDHDRTSYCKPVGREYLDSLSEVDRKGAVLAVALGRGNSEEGARKILRSCRIGKKDGGRYRGLNIIPWLAGRAYKERKVTKDLKTGKVTTSLTPKPDSTVEFRLHRNSMNPDRVIGWSQLCAKLVDWCANATDKEAQNLPKSPLRALCEVIAPELAPWILRRVTEWRKATKVSPYTKRRGVPRRIAILPDHTFELRAYSH